MKERTVRHDATMGAKQKAKKQKKRIKTCSRDVSALSAVPRGGRSRGRHDLQGEFIYLLFIISQKSGWGAEAKKPFFFLLFSSFFLLFSQCAPPIRPGGRNRKKLLSALRAGALSLVASDHSPSPPSLKASLNGSFFNFFSFLLIQISLNFAEPRGFGPLAFSAVAQGEFEWIIF